MTDTSIKLFGQTLDNPVIPASGTFGFGYEFQEYYDINVLGSISLKGTTLMPRYGNPLPRIADCPAGLLNAIGLQNPGIDKVVNEELVKLRSVYRKPVILNVGGHSKYEYVETVKRASGQADVLAIELNVSCPNVKGGGMAFGLEPQTVADLVGAVKAVSDYPIIVKLSPNVTDICEIAVAAEDGGADGISLINTLVGARINLKTARPILSTVKGGYSGRGLLPIAIRMVYDVYDKVNIPIIGMGGIESAYDVIEMMYAGATAVMVGSANLINPFACKEIINNLPRVMRELKIENIAEATGRAHRG